MKKRDTIIIGAGAAGLMCAIEAGKRGRRVIVLDHANKVGKKILMSGGGRCNFTNLQINPDNYLSHNRHFSKSALNRYTQWDFIELVKKHRIPFHEKVAGQLFCDNKSQDIVDMLLLECERANVKIFLNTKINQIECTTDRHFKIKLEHTSFESESLVIASGGLSIPTMGASPFGYKIAEQFGIKVWPTRAGLVPLTLHQEDKQRLSVLSGISTECLVSHQKMCFRENILFTHRGLSGPAILQISSYWEPGEEIEINLWPEGDLSEYLKLEKLRNSKRHLKTILINLLPKRVIETFLEAEIASKELQGLSFQEIQNIGLLLNYWRLKPNGTEGYRTAEVTLGGVDTTALSSKTFEVNHTPGLYFIGEVLDVSGWLGGFNFQWAWASGWAAGQVV
jgi:predicted Rossmann fold flavoprotein